MDDLPKPIEGAIIYEDDKLYVCLANFPISIGHTVVVWKDRVADLQLLDKNNYEYLMDTVDKTRDVMIDVLNIDKVYLLYMDEIKHVHWHLVPRYAERGFNMLIHNPVELKDASLADDLRLGWISR